MTTTHRIDIEPALRETRPGVWTGHGRAIMRYRGEQIGESAEPLFAAARILLDRGLADPDDVIQTFRGDTPCLRAKVGAAAGRSFVEAKAGGIRIGKYNPLGDRLSPRSVGVGIDETAPAGG